jgi:hypothetical protein
MMLLLRVAAITDRGSSIVQGTDCKEGVFVHLRRFRTTPYLSGLFFLLRHRPLRWLACKWHIKSSRSSLQQGIARLPTAGPNAAYEKGTATLALLAGQIIILSLSFLDLC